MIITYIGGNGVIYLERWKIAFHGVVTCAFLGAFFLYSTLEALFSKLEGEERYVLFFFSLPYLVDFGSGCCSFYLTYLLYKSEENEN